MPPARALPGALLLLLLLIITITTASSSQRLSAFLTPSDIAALRAEQNGEGDSFAFAAAGKAPPRRLLLLDAPTLSCVFENTTDAFISLEVCAGESGAPFGVLIEWMNVVAFARANGWLRATDPRLCRLRLTAPIAPDACIEAVIGGEAMLERLHPEPRLYPGWALGKWGRGEEGGNKNGDGHGSGHDDHPPPPPPPPPLLPGDAAFGDEACLEDLDPETFYVFRARARGTVDALRQGGEEEQGHDHKTKKKKGEDGGGDESGGDPAKERRAALPEVEPTLWSANEVCETAGEEEEEGGGVGPPSPPPVVVDLGP